MNGEGKNGNNRMEEYFRIREGDRRDLKEVYRNLQRGYGLEHPERVNSFQGLLFGRGNAFVSGRILEKMKITEYRLFVYDSLGSFYKEKYGDVSAETNEENGMSRWLGNGEYVTGRYGYFRGGYRGRQQFDEAIRIRKWKGDIWITDEGEPDLFLLAGEGAIRNLNGEELAADREGVDFLEVYRAHPEYYLPLTKLQSMAFPEYEGRSIRDSFWNAGILEDNRPYFAVCHGKHLEVYTSAIGRGGWRQGEWFFLQAMISRGLVKADNNQYRQRYPHVRPVQEENGCEFCRMWIELDTHVLSQTIRWAGKAFPFNDLKKLNARVQPGC